MMHNRKVAAKITREQASEPTKPGKTKKQDSITQQCIPLLKTGFNTDEIGKAGDGNFCRLFDAATAGHN